MRAAHTCSQNRKQSIRLKCNGQREHHYYYDFRFSVFSKIYILLFIYLLRIWSLASKKIYHRTDYTYIVTQNVIIQTLSTDEKKKKISCIFCNDSDVIESLHFFLFILLVCWMSFSKNGSAFKRNHLQRSSHYEGGAG